MRRFYLPLSCVFLLLILAACNPFGGSTTGSGMRAVKKHYSIVQISKTPTTGKVIVSKACENSANLMEQFACEGYFEQTVVICKADQDTPVQTVIDVAQKDSMSLYGKKLDIDVVVDSSANLDVNGEIKGNRVLSYYCFD